MTRLTRMMAIAVVSVVLVACSATVSPSLSVAPTLGGSPSPIESPSPLESPSPTLSPTPSESPAPTLGTSPAPNATPTTDELYLLSGVRRDASIGCAPVREVLPAGATGVVECVPNGAVVDRFRVTLFSSTDDVVAAYLAEMAANGVTLNSGSCSDGKGEGTYFPGPDDVVFAYRNGCFTAAVAQFRAIDVDGHVLIAVAGNSPDVSAELEAYAWLGNLDTPGAPTLWRSPVLGQRFGSSFSAAELMQ